MSPAGVPRSRSASMVCAPSWPVAPMMAMVMVGFLRGVGARAWWSVADGGRAAGVGGVVHLGGGEPGDVGATDGEPELVGAEEPNTQVVALRGVLRGDEPDDGPVEVGGLDGVGHAEDLVVGAAHESARHEADEPGDGSGLLLRVEDRWGGVADVAGDAVALHRVEDVAGGFPPRGGGGGGGPGRAPGGGEGRRGPGGR